MSEMELTEDSDRRRRLPSSSSTGPGQKAGYLDLSRSGRSENGETLVQCSVEIYLDLGPTLPFCGAESGRR